MINGTNVEQGLFSKYNETKMYCTFFASQFVVFQKKFLLTGKKMIGNPCCSIYTFFHHVRVVSLEKPKIYGNIKSYPQA